MSTTTTDATTQRGRVRIEDGGQARPRLPRRRGRRRHHRARSSSGRCPTTRRTTSRSPTSARSCGPTAGPSTRRAAETRRTFTVVAGGREAQGAAWRYEDSPIEALRDLVRLDWDAMDAWFEEDEEVFTHPRDPYTRVDILASSRHVRIEVGGATVAESASPRLLFETGLPVRYYLPKTARPARSADPHRDRVALPVQGPGGVVVGAGAGRRPRGPRVGVPHAAAREPEDRRAGRLLRREGRRPRRRGAPGAAADEVLLSVSERSRNVRAAVARRGA